METAAGGVDDRVDVQKKTFGKWLNSQLASAPGPPGKVTTVTDLFYDLRDGLVLLSVLEALTGKKMRRERGNLRVHQLSNVNNILSLLRENKVKLVNIGTVDIVDGNPKITLALVWAVILHWQFNKVLGEGLQHVSNLERSLLEWCRKSAGALGVPVRDFTASFQDGLAFAAIVHCHRPHLFDFDDVRRRSPAERLDLAFGVIEKHLGITRLLDPEDLVKPDKKSVMTYLMCVYEVLPHEDDFVPAAPHSAKKKSAAGKCPSENNIIGSPLKTPIKDMTNGKERSRQSKDSKLPSIRPLSATTTRSICLSAIRPRSLQHLHLNLHFIENSSWRDESACIINTTAPSPSSSSSSAVFNNSQLIAPEEPEL